MAETIGGAYNPLHHWKLTVALEVLALHKAGHTVQDIATKLRTHRTFVEQIITEYGQEEL